MNKVAVIISAVTAFVISAGGAVLTVTGSGNELNATAIIIAVVFGLMSAAKDLRSLFKLPPVSDTETRFSVKPKGPLLWLLCGFLSFGLVSVAVTGCSTSQQRIAFNSLATVQTTTVGAYDGYVSQVIAGRIATNDLPRVSQRFNEFQAAFRVALTTVEYNTNALAPQSLQVLSGDLLNLITTLSTKE